MSEQPRHTRAFRVLTRYWPALLAAGWFPLLLFITMGAQRVRTSAGPEPFSLCVLCGDRGGADLVLNGVMFVPLGLLLVRWLGVLRTVGVAAALSLVIELAQLHVAGRYSTLGDLIANSAGALAGALLFLLLARIARGWTPRMGVGLGLAAGVGAVTLLGGWLLEPAPTRDAYWGQWTPDHGRAQEYRGEVVAAHFNGLPFPSTRLPAEWNAREMMLQDWTLTGTVVKGTPPGWNAAILSIFDAEEREILYLGASREHLLLRERLNAQRWRLDRPQLVSWNALSDVSVGDTMRVAARRSGDDRCLTVDEREVCGLGFTPGRLWSLLLYPSSAPRWLQRAADFGWLAGLFLPLGLLARTWRGALLSGTLASGLIVLALTTTRLHLDPWLEPLGAAVGLVLGVGLAKGLERVRARLGGSGSDGTR